MNLGIAYYAIAFAISLAAAAGAYSYTYTAVTTAYSSAATAAWAKGQPKSVQDQVAGHAEHDAWVARGLTIPAYGMVVAVSIAAFAGAYILDKRRVPPEG